jgi:hypothetical protein
MKAIIFSIVLTLLISCSSDNNSNNSSNNTIDPPSWIQGNWYLEGEFGGSTTGYSFKSNDFCLIVFNTQTCFSLYSDPTISAGGIFKIEELISDNEYKISITQINTTTTYHFKKISSTKIEWINDPLGDLANSYYVKK